MDVLEVLGTALGLAALAGLNLYLTVFVTGLAVHFGWVVLPAPLHDLNVLGDPWVIGISGTLYFLEFFADKIPWVDSVSDAVQTVVRPVGGALLAVLALGEAPAVVKVVAALLAGGAALTTHATKSGTRLVANASPEPFSNIGLSLGEDVIVLGGLGLLALHPVVAFFLFLIVLGVLWTILPSLVRSMRAKAWLAWQKLNCPADGDDPPEFLHKLPAACELALRRAHATAADPEIVVPCLSGSGPRLPRNYRGWLVGFAGEQDRVYFVAERFRGPLVVEVRLGPTPPEHTPLFLAERLLLRNITGVPVVFLFTRGQRSVVIGLTEKLRRADEPAAEPVLV